MYSEGEKAFHHKLPRRVCDVCCKWAVILQNFLSRFLILILFLFQFSVAKATESVVVSEYGNFIHFSKAQEVLFLIGDIEENASFHLRKALRNHDVNTIALISNGGVTWEALQTAGIINDRKISTYIPSLSPNKNQAICASACSFLFFAGAGRVADGKLGVHQFYADYDQSERVNKTLAQAQFTASEIIGYLNEFGTPPFVYERMFEDRALYFFLDSEIKELERPSGELSQDIVKNINLIISEIAASIDGNVQADAPVDLPQESPGKPEIKTPRATCRTDPAQCDEASLCAKAVLTHGGGLRWVVTGKWLVWAQEARARNLSCGVEPRASRTYP